MELLKNVTLSGRKNYAELIFVIQECCNFDQGTFVSIMLNQQDVSFHSETPVEIVWCLVVYTMMYVNDELEWMLQETVVAYMRVILINALRKSEEAHENLQGSQSPSTGLFPR